ncbi:tether containing ubx domain for glut4 [Anaeramoeba ignava]|uniref:Tether containing ubx domain for glut4 n=1 Tax=Anaeramoeba ignava TaxID=1746090 RepID=A0A9Q0LWZ6_ANAIG|nr:tether containing ubx domain for glut4 [Anaeramoeba ignava]
MSYHLNIKLGFKQIHIKVIPSQTLANVITTICKKEKLKGNYKVIFQGKNIDKSVSIKVTGIPTNAKIELVEEKKRTLTAAQVKIAVQIERERLIGNFEPKQSLFDILEYFDPKIGILNRNYFSDDNLKEFWLEPCIIYMNKKYKEISFLKRTTLTSIGLTTGSALFRILFEKSGLTIEEAQEKLKEKKKLKKIDAKQKWYQQVQKEALEQQKKEALEFEKLKIKYLALKQIEEKEQKKEQEQKQFEEQQQILRMKQFWKEEDKKKEKIYELIRLEEELEKKKKERKKKAKLEKLKNFKHKIQVFPPSLQEKTSEVINDFDLPDNFFNPKAKELTQMVRNSTQKQEQSKMLQTKKLRKKLSKANLPEISEVILRFVFPDQYIIQITFLPYDTLQNIYQFLRENIFQEKKKDIYFYLYVTPPFNKFEGKNQKTLKKLQLLPASTLRVSFGKEIELKTEELIKEELLGKKELF